MALLVAVGVAGWMGVTAAKKQVAAEAVAKKATNVAEVEKKKAVKAKEVADDALEQSEKAKNLAGNILNQASVATLQAKGATAARVVVEIETKLTSLQEEKIVTEQQLEEAKQQVKKKGNEESRKDAKRQLEEVEKQLEEIEKKANGLNAGLEKAKLEKANANVRKAVESKQPESEQQAKQTGGGEAERKLKEVKRELANIEQEANVQQAKLEEVERATAETSSQESSAPDMGTGGSSAEGQSFAVEEPLAQDEIATQSSEAASPTANEFKQFEEDYGKLSVCEQFDELERFKPPRPFGPEAEFKLKALADLNALREKSAVVVARNNLLVGRAVSKANECESITQVKSQSSYKKGKIVCLYAWISSPGRNKVKLEMRGPDKKVIYSRPNINIGKNQLSGPRMGYRIWDARGVNSTGEYELRLYNTTLKKNPLICRSTFIVE